jgi:hypothetical protein
LEWVWHNTDKKKIGEKDEKDEKDGNHDKRESMIQWQ